MIEIAPGIAIEEAALEERFVRASGPGGQNVNKLASAVELRFHLERAGLPQQVRLRLATLAGRRLNNEGVLVIQAQRHRTQEMNRRDALERLKALIAAAAAPPPPPRKKTRVPRSAVRKRLDSKKATAGRKALRRPPAGDD
ncbi:MAG: aminoacyl-tRNA hydrolase [Hyphomicrobiales bacterium]|nr:aminoacyl-tRNA hydrolase [Hyphomicrobiales bacterium]